MFDNTFTQKVVLPDGQTYQIKFIINDNEFARIGVGYYNFLSHDDDLTAYELEVVIILSNNPNNDSLSSEDIKNPDKVVVQALLMLKFNNNELIENYKTKGKLVMIDYAVISDKNIESLNKANDFNINDFTADITAQILQ